MKRIGIIGAGRFGLSLAESLAEAGQEVLLLERNALCQSRLVSLLAAYFQHTLADVGSHQLFRL